MTSTRQSIIACALMAFGSYGAAQVSVTPATNQISMLSSTDAKLAANKRLVFDFWREVFEAGHLDLADKFMAESYIQHNPNVPTGRAAFVDFFGKFKKPGPVSPTISAPLIAITAEGNLVILSFVREVPDPKDSSKKFTTTWFDMFRIDNGKIAEHCDPANRQ